MTNPLPVVLPMVLALAGCAGMAGDPAPRSVRLSDSLLTLTLTDGTRCSVDWQAAPAGRIDGCGPGFAYAVSVEDNPNILRQLVEGVVLALGGQNVLAPMAEVVITGPDGKGQIFVSPPPAE